MSHAVPFALAVSPFGNFAVSIDTPRYADAEYTLTPIAGDTLPIKEVEGLGCLLDFDALADAHFTINRIEYTGAVTITLRKYHGSDIVTAFANTSSLLARPLSESASTKLADWFAEHIDELITPRLIAADTAQRAQRTAHYAERDVRRIETQLAEARQTLAGALAHAEVAEAVLADTPA